MVSISVVVLSLIAVAAATNVVQCPGKSFQNLSDNVQLTPCKKLPCRLKKGTNQHISITFVAEKDVDDVKNNVHAIVASIPLPFVGVDGNSICDKIFSESGEKESCPLKAGTKYVYKDSFPILSFYPSLDLRVNWSLKHKDTDIVCFEVPARITS